MFSSIPGLIRNIAMNDADRPALIVEGAGRLTYRELDARGNAIATGLLARGVGHGDLVGLSFAAREWLDYVCAYLGILKAGAGAVVLSDGATSAELRNIAANCTFRGIVTGHRRTFEPIAEWIAELAEVEAGQSNDPVDFAGGPDDVALILHTSGTTGRPKGVPMTHGHIAAPALGSGAASALSTTPARVLHTFPIATTAGQIVLGKELGSGNALHVLPEFDVDRFCSFVAANQVERVLIVPAMGHWLARSGKHETRTLDSVDTVTFSSAPLPVAVLDEMRALFPNAQLENLYSSTEIAPGMTVTVVDPDRPGSVGRPIGGCEVRVTDEDGSPLAPGTEGEVRMRIPGIAGRRYLGDAETSTRTFDGDWVATGDLGYLDEDGCLYLVDRKEDVLNPGGLKVAPSEVEAVLEEHPAVVEAAVFGVEHPVLDHAVTAAVVTSAEVTPAELKQFARERLVSHKIPVAVHYVDALPRNKLGKIVRRELARQVREKELAASPGEPRTPTELRLAQLWLSVLGNDADSGQDDITVRSNFFDIGGHSLVITRLARRITDEFGVTPTITGLFDYATLAEQALYLDKLPPSATASGDGTIEPLAADVVAPQSFIQDYMWRGKRGQLNPGWNVFLPWRLRGPLDVRALRDTIALLVRRQEILRTRLAYGPGGPTQHVIDDAEIGLERIDLSELAEPVRAAQFADTCRRLHRTSLDLEHGPALAAALLRLSAEEHVLLLTLDHASCDGWSAGVLISEFTAAYEALADGRNPVLEPLPIQYRDFSAHQRRLAAEGAYDARIEYWREQLADMPAEPMLPRAASAPSAPGYRSGLRAVHIEAALAESLRELGRQRGHTVFMTLLGTLMAAIATVSGRTDLVVASMSAGRHHPEVGSLIGMFANPLLLRADVATAASIGDLYDNVRDVTVRAYDHEQVPFPLLADKIGQRAGEPEVWFNMAPPMPTPQVKRMVIDLADVPRNYSIDVPPESWRGENLMVNGVDTGLEIDLEFDYNTKAIDAATIDRLCESYMDLLRTAVSDPTAPLPLRV